MGDQRGDDGEIACAKPSPLVADLTRALDELYTYYEATEPMLANAFRDAPHVPAVESALDALRAALDDAARILASGWPGGGRRGRTVAAACRHAVDFRTWQSLVRDGGVSRADAIELSSAMVLRAVDLPASSRGQPPA